ncbi:MAG: type II secretion system F family protein [Chloroflexi bacterium]|nr:type II secretion system F family protein [Chloroflexota bacterium]
MNGLIMVIPFAVFVAGTAFFYALYRLLRPERQLVKARLGHYGVEMGSVGLSGLASGVLRQRRLSGIEGMNRLLARGGLGDKIALDLARAAVPLRVGEYVLIRWLIALTLFVVGTIGARTVIAGLLLGACGFYLPKLYVRHSEQKRVKKFNDQLVDSLSLMANSLRSGFGLMQGLEAVSREMPSPISEEFDRVLHEIRMGATTEEALAKLPERVRSADLDLVVTAMLVQRSVGGNLSEVLDTIGHTIRERIRILREIRTLTAQERLSGYVIGALPIFMVIVISMVNRSYIEMLFFTTVGRLMLGIAAVLEIIGFLITKKIVAIEV